MTDLEFEKLEIKRAKVIEETNAHNIQPFNRDIFRQTKEEREKVKLCKSSIKSNKGTMRAKAERDEILKAIATSRTPRFGSLTLTIL